MLKLTLSIDTINVTVIQRGLKNLYLLHHSHIFKVTKGIKRFSSSPQYVT